MRRTLIATVLLCLSLGAAAACSNSGDKGPVAINGSNPAASSSTGANGSPLPGASGGTSTGGGAPGSLDAKASCEALTAKLGAWGADFAKATADLGGAGNDVSKVEPIVKSVQATNTKFAGELRAEAVKAKDPQIKKAAEDLASTLDKVNGQLNPSKVAQDPSSLLVIFDTPEFSASADAFQKACGA